MRMFDNLIVKRKLPLSKELKKTFPDTDWSQEDFQTKDLDNTMTTYTIKGTGLYWDKVDGEYAFKAAHAIAYSQLVVVNLNLLCEQV